MYANVNILSLVPYVVPNPCIFTLKSYNERGGGGRGGGGGGEEREEEGEGGGVGGV